MRRRLLATLRRARREESGFTLIELLVVCLVSIVVVLALFMFQDVVLRGSNRVFAEVDATQRARTAMETIMNRLRSSCLAENITPIQAGSTGTSLVFLTKYGSAASLSPEKHTIALSGSNLTDTTQTVTGGAAPNWTWSAGTTRTLLTNVSQSGSTPLFRYFAYGIARDSGGQPYLDAAGNTYMILLDGTSTMPNGTTTSTGASVPTNTIPANSPTPLTTPLSVADSKITAEVMITMQVGAGGRLGNNSQLYKVPATVQDSAVLRLTPVPSEGNLPTVPPCA